MARASTTGSDGCAAAVPLAAALAIALAHRLPIRFDYHPDDLGIVSLTTLARYPVGQETFWLVFGVAAGLLFAWPLARALAAPRIPVADLVAVEALAAGALLAALWLPGPADALGTLLALAAALALAVRARARPQPAPAAPPLSRSPARGTLVWLVGAPLLAPLLVPGLWPDLWHVAQNVPDAQLVRDDFRFLGESGQHLAWADALWRGAFQGRDFFCLYGPLYDLVVVGLWELLGRSIAVWNLIWSLGRAAGWLVLLLLGGVLVRRRPIALAIPCLLPWTDLRVGLALLSLLCLVQWLRGGRVAWCAAGGAVAGASLLYSQEFGAALLVAAAAGFAVRRAAGPALAFAAAGAASTAPLLAYYAAHGALGPMLHDLLQYPRYLMAGYANLPFPQLLPSLPFHPAEVGSRPFLELRLGYAVPALHVGALILALPLSSLEPRRPLASLGAALRALARDPDRLALALVALFGLLSFRSALGRSSLHRTHAVLPAVALVLCFALDRVAELWRRERALRPLALWRAAALALFVLHGGFVETGRPLALVRASFESLSRKLSGEFRPVGSVRVNRVARWIERNTEPGEPVLFLPNDAAYYYLADRPSPIRFVLGSQIVTAAHRAEVLDDLRRRPPRYVVWDDAALRVDDLPDELVFGAPLLDWIDANYTLERRIGEVRILRRRLPPE